MYLAHPRTLDSRMLRGRGAYRRRARRTRTLRRRGARRGGRRAITRSFTRYSRGRGGYKIGSHALMGQYTSTSSDPPVMKNRALGRGDTATQVRHREFLGNVTADGANIGGGAVGPTAWALSSINGQTGIAINPGLNQSFPWLSAVAGNFIQYEVNGMIVEFISTSGVLSTASSSLGAVSMACQYDAVLPEYGSKQSMLNEEKAVSGVPSQNLMLPIECAPRQTTLSRQYIRTGPQAANTDLRMYDLGTIYIATDGVPGGKGTVLGELWITYDVILYKASLENALATVAATALAAKNPNNINWETSCVADLYGATIEPNTIVNPLDNVNNLRLFFPDTRTCTIPVGSVRAGYSVQFSLKWVGTAQGTTPGANNVAWTAANFALNNCKILEIFSSDIVTPVQPGQLTYVSVGFTLEPINYSLPFSWQSAPQVVNPKLPLGPTTTYLIANVIPSTQGELF